MTTILVSTLLMNPEIVSMGICLVAVTAYERPI